MSRISAYRQLSKDVREKHKEFAVERSKRTMMLANSEQYKFFAEVKQPGVSIDSVITAAVDAAFESFNMFEDTLRSQGFRQGQIHKLVTKLYREYMGDDEGLSYEEMIGPVADYVYLNQHLYDTFNPTKL